MNIFLGLTVLAASGIFVQFVNQMEEENRNYLPNLKL